MVTCSPLTIVGGHKNTRFSKFRNPPGSSEKSTFNNTMFSLITWNFSMSWRLGTLISWSSSLFSRVHFQWWSIWRSKRSQLHYQWLMIRILVEQLENLQCQVIFHVSQSFGWKRWFVAELMSQSNDRMTFYQRFLNTIIRFSSFFFPIVPILPSYKDPNVQFDPLEALANASFVFMNSNPYLEFPRATLTKNVQIGGISVNLENLKSGKVDEDWNRILNLKKKTMLVSFGSVILSKDMPIERRWVLEIAV